MTEPNDILAEHIFTVRADHIPAQAIERAKLAVLDIVACVIAANRNSTAGALKTIAHDWSAGGPAQATLYGTGEKYSAPIIAFANSAMARMVDFDDTYELAPGGGHASAYIIPSALAVAEASQFISGRDVLAAIAVAQDVYCRLARSVRANCIDTGRDNMFSVFGSTTAVARLLRLDAGQIRSAFGIAYTQAQGEMQMYEEGADTVALQQGFRARAGLESAYLARAGLRGPRNVFLGRYGFYRVFEPESDVNLLLNDLGSDYLGTSLSFKPYPCCKCNHPAIQAALALRSKYSVTPESIDALIIGTNRLTRDFVAEPRDVKWGPRTVVDGRFSLPYTVSVAVKKGTVDIEDFTDEAIEDPTVKRIMSVTEVLIDPDIEKKFGEIANAPAVVSIVLRDGQTISERVDVPKGHPLNPASYGDGVAKLRRCADSSGIRFLPHDLDRLSEAVANLDRAGSFHEFSAALTPRTALH